MTVYGDVPSITTYLGMRLARRVSQARNREATKSTNGMRAWVQTTVRLVAHLAGFSLLTSAGFTWNMTAGLIVAGLSCFVFAWLLSDSASEATTAQPRSSADPMASRR